MRPAGLALCALLIAGCAQNAILELQVQLPPNPPGETWFAQIQVRTAPTTDPLSNFRINWMGNDLRTVPLTSVSQWDCVSVEGLDPSVSLHVKVRFCRAEDCLDLLDGDPPERLYSLETPFYIGSRTYHRIVVPAVPDCASTEDCQPGVDGVPEQSIGVCIEGRCACSVDSDCQAGFACAPGVGCAEIVDRCAIEGCVQGPVSSTFCIGVTNQHFCDRNPNLLRDDTFMCSLPD